MIDDSIQACIAACLACMRKTLQCADTCCDHPELRSCERTCRKCFAACVLWLADLHEGIHERRRSRLACAYACELCADACDKHQGASYRECATAGRDCAEACRKAASRPNGRGWETILPDLLD